ncbi:MAG TPA: DeoR/GlpR family DNA-binding transcription regulator [Bacillales bacterium]|nr:DeoR/GlpR family DNA-binding transcription regulator [Bacillales bacterium]
MPKMFVAERRNKIMEILNEQQRITVKELSSKMNVSEATLRTDLNQMEEQGLLKRTHGGAMLNDFVESETSFSVREKKHKDEKIKIAEKAAEWITYGQCILLDASSTALELARILKKQNLRLTVVTSGIYTALELRENPEITTILLGGVIRNGSSSLEGTLGMDILNKINIDLMFTSANGFSFETGLTDFNVYEVELKKEMVRRAKQVIALIDHSKIDKSSIASFAETHQIYAFITDSPLTDDLLSRFSEHGIQVTSIH